MGNTVPDVFITAVGSTPPSQFPNLNCSFKEGIMHITIILNSQCIIVLLQNFIWLVYLDIGALLG